jgi:hypothetical protein
MELHQGARILAVLEKGDSRSVEKNNLQEAKLASKVQIWSLGF